MPTDAPNGALRFQTQQVAHENNCSEALTPTFLWNVLAIQLFSATLEWFGREVRNNIRLNSA